MARKSLSAYSLLEIIIIIGVFTGLSLIYLPIGIEQLQSNKVDNIVRNIQSTIYNQSQSAFSYRDNKSYGIAFYTNRYIIYTGTSLAQAESQSQIDLTNEITITNIDLLDTGNDINFASGSFRPSTSGKIQVTAGNTTYQISINTEGLLLITKI